MTQLFPGPYEKVAGLGGMDINEMHHGFKIS